MNCKCILGLSSLQIYSINEVLLYNKAKTRGGRKYINILTSTIRNQSEKFIIYSELRDNHILFVNTKTHKTTSTKYILLYKVSWLK